MKTITQMFHHLFWANERILQSLQQQEQPQARTLFAHILFAEQIWITRLQGKDSSQLPLWEEADMNTCDHLAKNNKEIFLAYLDDLKPEDLDKNISYQNSTDKEFTNTIREILTHVALHGQHHRGQINTLLRAAGQKPPILDFIAFTR